MNNQFEWVDFYKELAKKLLSYKDNREELVEKVKCIFDETGIKLPTLEKDNEIVDIDPFTAFGLFNKTSMREENRIKIISAIKNIFEVKAEVPKFFDSIPVLNPLNATYYYFVDQREDKDIDELWNLFDCALKYADNPSAVTRETTSQYFNAVINKKGNGNSKVTMGLYWIAPETFLNLDSRNEWFIYKSGRMPAELVETLPSVDVKISADKYFIITEKIEASLTCVGNYAR